VHSRCPTQQPKRLRLRQSRPSFGSWKPPCCAYRPRSLPRQNLLFHASSMTATRTRPHRPVALWH